MSRSSSGAFIVLDGIDGCGKTLHSKDLCWKLRGCGFDAAYTTEPSYGHVGKLIRSKFFREKIRPEVEALLFAADRFEHLSNKIIPWLEAGRVVVSDRYVYASIAYQGAQGVALDWIRKMNCYAPKPDLAIYLDVPAEIGLARIERRKTVFENIKLQRAVRQIYLELVRGGELTMVDATGPIHEVRHEILALVLRKLEQKGVARAQRGRQLVYRSARLKTVSS